MKIPQIVWLLAGVALVTAFGVAAGGGPDGSPSAADVARFAGCDSPVSHPSPTGARESVACREGGYDVTVMTFDDNAQRDQWVDDQKWQVAAYQLSGVGSPLGLVAGDRWAALTGDPAAYDRLATAARGWRV